MPDNFYTDLNQFDIYIDLMTIILIGFFNSLSDIRRNVLLTSKTMLNLKGDINIFKQYFISIVVSYYNIYMKLTKN